MKEIIITVIDLPENFSNGAILVEWLKNWLHDLEEVKLAHTALIIGANYYTCRVLRQGVIPCYEDTSEYLANTEQTIPGGRVAPLKWFYLKEALDRGYHVLYMESDTVLAADPIRAWDRSYDFQAILDTDDSFEERNWLTRDRSCKQYEHGGLAPIDSAIKPCMSTAFMYLRATPAGQALADSMVTSLLKEPSKWEQQLLQEVVPAFMFGEGDSPVLRSRTLPLKGWLKFATLELRKRNRVEKAGAWVAVSMHGDVQGKRDAAYALGRW